MNESSFIIEKFRELFGCGSGKHNLLLVLALLSRSLKILEHVLSKVTPLFVRP
jgi:hypothetical protein